VADHSAVVEVRKICDIADLRFPFERLRTILRREIRLIAELFREIAAIDRDRLVRLKEHMFVKVREAVELGRLGKRTVAHGKLDRYERHAVVRIDDDLK